MVIYTIATFFTFVFSSLLFYKKALSFKRPSFLVLLLAIPFSIGLAYGMYFIQKDLPILSFVLSFFGIVVFNRIALQTELRLTVILSVISICICFAFYYLSNLISTALHIYVFSTIHLSSLALTTLFLTLLMVNIPFLFKRTRKGFFFLKNKGNGNAGLFISGMLFLLLILMNLRDLHSYHYIILLLGIMFCIAEFILWWRNCITKFYLDQLNEQERKALEVTLKEKEKDIQKLVERNDFLASIIHRDNKLIPALYNTAVESHQPDPNDGINGWEQLNQLVEERADAILQDQRKHKKLPLTNVPLIDSLLQFMYRKATQSGIEFDLRLMGNIKFLTETIIPEIKLETLVADLVENALIAAINGTTKSKRIFITAGISDEVYEWSIQDNGVPFQKETLMNLGVQKTTNYEGNGGSGIGYMETFKIMRETSASLLITEHPPKPDGFQKTVAIRFDGKNEYTIQSFRSKELSALCKRADLTILPI